MRFFVVQLISWHDYAILIPRENHKTNVSALCYYLLAMDFYVLENHLACKCKKTRNITRLNVKNMHLNVDFKYIVKDRFFNKTA